MARGGRWWIGPALAAVAVGWCVSPPSAAAGPPLPVRDERPPNGLCLICHSQPGLTAKVGEEQERPIAAVDPQVFEASAHGSEDCVACHAVQSALPHPRLGAQEQRDTREATACLKCHGDAYEGYLDSLHGTMVKLDDARAPACADCHGNAHEVQPIQEWTAHERAQACAGCHPGASTSFLEVPSHEEPSPHFLPSAYFAERFLVILTATVLAFAVIHVELDMLRWFVRWRQTHSGRITDDGDPAEPPSAAGGGS